MFFCPTYGGDCRNDCRDWDLDSEKCTITLANEARTLMDAEYMKMVKVMEIFGEAERLNTIRMKAACTTLMNMPGISAESKEFMRRILEASSSEVADQLLAEFGFSVEGAG